MASDQGRESGQNRFRAAKACQRCNQRRIKCDAVERGLPCTKCKQHGKVECKLIHSRRGTYPRKKTKVANGTNEFRSQDNSANSEQAVENPSSSGPPPMQSYIDDGGDDQPLFFDSQPSQMGPVHTRVAPDLANDQARTTPAASALTGNTNVDLASPESNATDVSTSSYREISWQSMFDHFLDSRRRKRKDIIDKCSITYLGESFPLALILEDTASSGTPRVHHPGPPLEDEQEHDEGTRDPRHPSHMLPEDIDFLQAKQAFKYPDDQTLDALVSTFLERFFPMYPVVNLQEFTDQHKNKTLPWILLHAICFVASTFCPVAVLHRAGFVGRKQARLAYYRKAKALFDTGYEHNKIVILQSTILLTFWGGGPNNYWNFYSWIGTGVTIAETLGIHRSLAGTNMKKQDRSLLKRLWWILLIRDTSCGALVGRPFRISMDHSDTEMLTDADFEDDARCPDMERHPLRQSFGPYQIHMSTLSLILREIIITRFGPRGKTQTPGYLSALLHDWRSKLPPELTWSDSAGGAQNVFASSLAIMYHHHLILTHLDRGSQTPGPGSSVTEILDGGTPGAAQQRQHQRSVAEAAAQRISALASSLVTKSQVLMTPHETFHGLFIAEVVFYAQMKSRQPMVAQLGRMALNNCQMVLHDVKEAWDPAPWVMQLFDNLVNNFKDESAVGPAEVPPQTQTFDQMRFGFSPNAPGAGVDGTEGMVDLEQMPGMNDFNTIQSNTMLSTFFDLSNDADAFSALDYSGFPSYMGDLDDPSMLQ